MDLHILSFLAFLSVAISINEAIEPDTFFRYESVYCKDRKCTHKSNVLDWTRATAIGTFNDTLLVSGWGVLDIKAGYGNEPPSNLDLMFAAGYVEGRLTAHQMDGFYTNLRAVQLPAEKMKLFKALKAWFIQQRNWTDAMVSQHQETDPLWRHVGYIMAQLDGLLEGYRTIRNTPDAMDMFAVTFVNAAGDIGDLMNALDPDSIPDWSKFTPEEASDYFNTRGHCSALVKITPGYENILFGHSSWNFYSSLNRVYKHYNFNLNDAFTHGNRMSFCSYPGGLESNDAFYLLNSGMSMVQTSLITFNTTLYSLIQPNSLLTWQRVLVSNLMSNSGEEWANNFKQHNSGTYNNEYLVIDLKKFTPNKQLQDGTLWLIDQMPGIMRAVDATNMLRDGYMPSYNVPFIKEMYDISGTAEFVKVHGQDWSYDLSPRAKIFRRDQRKVTDITSMKALMRYNDYKHDEYGGDKPSGAICARQDLLPSHPAFGCMDTKVADLRMSTILQASVISGPTLGTNLPPFSWTGPFVNFSHVGLPPKYEFPFINTQPRFD